MRIGFTADEATFVEQPLVLAVELLERIVRQDRGVHLVGDAQHEGVATPDGAGRWGNEFVVVDGIIELGAFARVDAVAEGGVNHHGDE